MGGVLLDDLRSYLTSGIRLGSHLGLMCISPDFQVSFMLMILMFCEGTRRVAAQTRRVGSRLWTWVHAWTRRVQGMDSASPSCLMNRLAELMHGMDSPSLKNRLGE